MLKKDKKEKSSYELRVELFGKYSSGKDDLSTTYNQAITQNIV